jgi:hypothetical protein
VSPVKYELGFYIPEDDIIHSHRRENLNSYMENTCFTLYIDFKTKTSLIRRRYVPMKRRFLHEPHGVSSQMTPFFIVTAVKASNLINLTEFD